MEQVVAFTLLPEFLNSPASDPVLPLLLRRDPETASLLNTMETLAQRLLWPGYSPRHDVANWLYALVIIAQDMPVSVSVSDMSVAGSPLVYVNPRFSEESVALNLCVVRSFAHGAVPSKPSAT